MEQAKLMVHRGATRVTREELAHYEPPEATATWKPIKHAYVVDCLYEDLDRRQIGVTHEEYAVQRKGNYLFGVMTLNYLKTDEFAAALAFRHCVGRLDQAVFPTCGRAAEARVVLRLREPRGDL